MTLLDNILLSVLLALFVSTLRYSVRWVRYQDDEDHKNMMRGFYSGTGLGAFMMFLYFPG